MIRSPLLRFQLQDALGAASPEALDQQLTALAATSPHVLKALQSADATYLRFGNLQQASAEVGGLVVSEWDLKTGRIESGKSWKTLLGYGAGEVGDTVSAWRGLVQPDDLKALSAAIGAHIREASARFSLNCRCRCRDQSWRWLRVSGRVLARDDNGEPARLVVVQQDVDAERRMAESLEEARQAAEAAGRSRTAFLANMSHEIRTPMNAILGMTELALDTQLDAEQRHYLGTVRSSCEALLSIVNDILDFSKIEAGKLQVEKIDFELAAVVLEAVRSLAVGAQQKGLDIVVDVDPTLPSRVWGDPLRLRQVLTNLIGNAIKFTETGSIAVVLRVRGQQGDRCSVQVEVRDTGVGIPADKQRQIFDAFSQADVSTTRRFGGTGLGLAISARLVELMGGALQVASEVGKGSVFGFVLNLLVQEPARLRALPPALMGRRVLLVGQAGAGMRLLESLFTRWSMQPVSVSSVVEARAEAGKARGGAAAFSLAVVDATTVLDGDASEYSAWLAETGHEPMVALLTVAGQREHLPRLKALGVTLYVVKPVAGDDLLDAMSLAIASQSGGFELAGFEIDEAALLGVGASAKTLRILVVEDNPINQELALRLLERAGHAVTLASNGKEAVDCFENGAFDVILMDMQMPVMNGIEATQAIRARELRRSWVQSSMDAMYQLPIIAMTANAMSGDRELCLQAGMTDYVSKPIRQEELFAALARVTSGESAATVSQASPIGTNVAIDAEAAIRDLGDAALVRQMARMLLDQWGEHVNSVGAALSARDEHTLCRAAHTFKGLLAMFHAESARRHALAIELSAREGKWDEADREWVALGHALAQVKPELEFFVDR